MTKDPVCEMPVEEDDANTRLDLDGHTYFFCSATCKEEFESDPEKYLSNIDLDLDEGYDHSA